MSKIETRIENAEKKLNLDGEQRVVSIALFVEGPLPPDERHGNYIIHYVNGLSAAKDGREGAQQA